MASDKEIKQLAMYERDLRRFTVIKAVRDKDIDPTEPLSITKEKLELLGASIDDYKMIHLTDLTEESIKKWRRE